MRDANKNSEPQIDRMGCYIGQVRAYEGVPLEQLAQGLCTKSYLCRVENGEREAAARDLLRVIRAEDPEEFALARQRGKIEALLNGYEEVETIC